MFRRRERHEGGGVGPGWSGTPGLGGAQSPTRPITVVAIGASAGGLEAFQRLLDVMPVRSGLAFIMIQHLDPTHPSMMVDLLASHTPMPVQLATDGMPIEADHVYVIPPGVYLAARNGVLRLSAPREHHGARLPFDFLLESLAEERGERSIGVVLSGSGADGSAGVLALKASGGFIIAQDPEEAGYDGMPRSAIATGAVDLVEPIARIPAALVARDHAAPGTRAPSRTPSAGDTPEWLNEIIELLRRKTTHDFTLYKRGTLQRRIERRIAMAGMESEGHGRYLELLRDDPKELDLLAKDLLINVTSFFRDPQVFALLSKKVVPDLVRDRAPDQPVRIWIAGCSTGEETYSLAMLFREQITATNRAIKLQVFASDVDPDAIAVAREGHYPESIANEVSPERLARFFTKVENGYRIQQELRTTVVFTVQDVLADPPFSRLDLISCRNLLIYLLPDAQAKVISLFHFALREGGVLLLGSSEAIAGDDVRFEPISEAERIFRHVARSRPGELSFSLGDGISSRMLARLGPPQAPSHQAAVAEHCRRLILDGYAPAAMLVNHRNECVYSLGPTDRFLHVVPGQPTHDVLAMARRGVRGKLRSAIQQATEESRRVTIAGPVPTRADDPAPFRIVAEPVQCDGEALLLVCFIDEPKHEGSVGAPPSARDAPRIAELERELEASRAELEDAIHSLEIATDAQRQVNEEALSINEEYQATNEELLTSKEELQSVNEELTALNGQLQETLEHQRTTSNDLQNVLYSTNLATLFLDTDFKIRFFTPATRSLFSVIPGDVGRPLSDLRSLAIDEMLLPDSRTVLRTLEPIEREIETRNGVWYLRRALPYRTQDGEVEGIVIIFADITERRRAAAALEAARLDAQRANIAKSRFLAAASHDLRQPLQTLALLQGLLSKQIEGDAARKLLGLLDQTLGAMSGMLNTLLDINQIEAGTVHAEVVAFPIAGLLDRLRNEFTYHAQAKGLVLRVVSSGATITSDPLLLEQMIRNLLSNAMKYTKRGKVLLGCRRRGDKLSLEVWDTGIGIPAKELQAIFEEYHQVDNGERARGGGLGLGLSIVQRLGQLLGHPVTVRSNPSRGSGFIVTVPVASTGEPSPRAKHRERGSAEAGISAGRTGTILVIEDDPEIRDLLELLLVEEGHDVTTAADGLVALDLVTRARVHPDLILADYNLPNGMDGLAATAGLRTALRRAVPAIILTGDISTATLRDIAVANCTPLNKPVKAVELTNVIRRLLPPAARPADASATPRRASTRIIVVDDDAHLLDVVRRVLEGHGWQVETHASGESLLASPRPTVDACLLIDATLPGMSGLELLQRLRDGGDSLPAILMTGHSDVSIAVRAMKAGAADLIEKPVGHAELIASIERALERARDADKLTSWHEEAAKRIAALTPRQRQVMEAVLAGQPSKNIAADLGISRRTVENHRAEIMKKTGSKSLPVLARLALAASAFVYKPAPVADETGPELGAQPK